MIKVEKFKFKNISIIEKFMNLNHKLLNKNFLKVFNNSPFIDRYILKNNFYFLKYQNIYIGYIWFEKTNKNEFKILDLFIDNDFSELFSINIIQKFKKKFLVYECIKDSFSNNLMEKNSFIEIKNVLLMKKSLFSLIDFKVNLNKNLSFKKFQKNIDENLRCNLQNEIFSNKNRVPLLEADIFFDQCQEYYLNDFSIFLYYENLAIGYAQIIKKENYFFLVNFGIKKEFRKNNFGEYLLNHMCNLAYTSGIKDLYINVNSDNSIALNLYKKNNFITLYSTSTWIKDS